jgi:hypothetical protein
MESRESLIKELKLQESHRSLIPALRFPLPQIDCEKKREQALIDKFVVIIEIRLDVDAASGLLAVVRRGADNHRRALVLHFLHIAEPDILDWTPGSQKQNTQYI